MSIIVNGVSIPTNGNFIKIGDTNITKVDVVKDGVTTTVWEKITSVTPTPENILNYVTLSGASFARWCSEHPNTITAELWNLNQYKENRVSAVLTPKSPYTKIKATLHLLRAGWGSDKSYIKINGEYRLGGFDVPNGEPTETITVGPSNNIRIELYNEGSDGTWKTIARCCVVSVTLS